MTTKQVIGMIVGVIIVNVLRALVGSDIWFSILGGAIVGLIVARIRD